MNDLTRFSRRVDFFPVEVHVQASGIAQGDFHLSLGRPHRFLLGFEENFELRLIIRLYAHPRLLAGLHPENVSSFFLLLGDRSRRSRGHHGDRRRWRLQGGRRNSGPLFFTGDSFTGAF